MLNETIAIYAIIDDLLKAIGHDEDCRRNMSDAEIITTVIIAAMFFNGNHEYCLWLYERSQLDTTYVRKVTLQSTIARDINVDERYISSSRNDTERD